MGSRSFPFQLATRKPNPIYLLILLLSCAPSPSISESICTKDQNFLDRIQNLCSRVNVFGACCYYTISKVSPCSIDRGCLRAGTTNISKSSPLFVLVRNGSVYAGDREKFIQGNCFVRSTETRHHLPSDRIYMVRKGAKNFTQCHPPHHALTSLAQFYACLICSVSENKPVRDVRSIQLFREEFAKLTDHSAVDAVFKQDDCIEPLKTAAYTLNARKWFPLKAAILFYTAAAHYHL